jgi:hypothetical protein
MNKSNTQAATIEIAIRGIRTRLFLDEWTTPLTEVQELFYEILKLKLN